jgi:hypothetical protein
MQNNRNNEARKARIQLLSRNVAPVQRPKADYGGESRELEQLKARLLEAQLAADREVTTHAWLRQAANEAAALAWSTEYPALVLPELMEEKRASALTQAARQQKVTMRSRATWSLAA